ncbi:hypothetical protein FB567DRAFT_591531 [Paraphoma chrysanthemicola]|uniref:DUF6536 domain-containing protein n=1 Tax=Paraphoma chrysanthemicola TaxID=798071 RepID=A0A8K0R9D9_9PLEO|nr:hypothetical protein FB567DRAFT_591531 [Paraphoma chrysanthemicola]
MEYVAGKLSSPDTYSLPSHERKQRISGWRGGVTFAVACSASVLLVNVICAIVAATAGQPSDGIATAYTGDCKVATRWTTGLHLLINVLSSMLLGASNYCMQRLVAPTRTEIDKAHAAGKWLDIGMPSLRNLSSISKKRLMLWILLAASSIPLHLFYNSVVFGTVATNYVDILVVTPRFFTTSGGWKNDYRDLSHDYYQHIQDSLLGGRYLDRSVFENVTAEECFARYSASFITSGNCFAVPTPDRWQSSSSDPNSSLLGTDQGVGYLGGRLDPTTLSYCLSEILPERCQVQLSQTILYIVIAFNFLKVVLMISMVWRLNDETIVTVGDAIRSFLQSADDSTRNCCLMSRSTIDKIWKTTEPRHAQRYHGKTQPWFKAVSGRRWGLSLSLYIATIITAIYLLVRVRTRGWGCTEADGYTKKSCSLNTFDHIDFDHLLHVQLGDRANVIPYVLLANLPQAIVSVLYLSYNGIFTCMLANREWARYAVKRAGLRVTTPSASQRSTYFLSLPYTYSVPLLLTSILLHWFISQSIFMARITMWQQGVQITEDNPFSNNKDAGSDLAFSDAALIASIAWGAFLVIACVLVAGVCTYSKGLPIGGTNSAVISAACHVPSGDGMEGRPDDNISEIPLQWGVTIEGTAEKVGHCCFSDQQVKEPEEGCLYAGS